MRRLSDGARSAAVDPCGQARVGGGEQATEGAALAAAQSLRDGWIELAQRYTWDWWCTLTFSDEIGPESASKKFRYWVNRLNRALYGRHWQGKSHRGVFWLRASEYQKRGVLHYHALLAATHDLNTMVRRLCWMDEWARIAGFAKIEGITDQVAVTKYVTKYAVKGGDIELSENLSRYCRQAALALPRSR